jgi:hypothetical protein
VGDALILGVSLIVFDCQESGRTLLDHFEKGVVRNTAPPKNLSSGRKIPRFNKATRIQNHFRIIRGHQVIEHPCMMRVPGTREDALDRGLDCTKARTFLTHQIYSRGALL